MQIQYDGSRGVLLAKSLAAPLVDMLIGGITEIGRFAVELFFSTFIRWLGGGLMKQQQGC